jgi:hypothetical protein
LLLAGVTMLAGVSLGAQFLVEGLLFGGAGVAGLYVQRGLRQASVGARQAAAGMAALGGVFYLWSALTGMTIEFVPLVMVAVFVGLLYIPQECQAFFSTATTPRGGPGL